MTFIMHLTIQVSPVAVSPWLITHGTLHVHVGHILNYILFFYTEIGKYMMCVCQAIKNPHNTACMVWPEVEYANEAGP